MTSPNRRQWRIHEDADFLPPPSGGGGGGGGTRAVLLSALLLTACADKGKLKEPAALTPIADSPLRTAQVWNETPGSGSRRVYSGLKLAAGDDALLAADLDGDVFALNPQTGALIWEAATGVRVIAGPGVYQDRVLVGTRDGEVLALNRADGRSLWRVKLSSEVLAPPVSDGSTVIARTVDGKLWALNAETGARLWAFDRSVPPLTLRGLSTPLIVGDIVLAGLDNGRIVAVRLADGQPVWEQVVTAPAGRSELERITDIDAELLLGDKLLYVASFGGELVAISVEDGQPRWRRSIRSSTGFALRGEVLAITDENGVVWGLDANSGAQIWKQESLLNRRLSQPALHGDYLVVTDLEGYLHWIAPADGRLVARERIVGGQRGNPRNEPRVRGVSPGFATPPVVHGGLLYVMTAAGRIAAVEARPRS